MPREGADVVETSVEPVLSGPERAKCTGSGASGRRPFGPDRHWRGGGKRGRVSIKRSQVHRDMVLVLREPDRVGLTPAQLDLATLLRERPGEYVTRLSALDDQYRAAVKEATARRRAAPVIADGSIQDTSPAGPPVAMKDDRLKRVLVPEKYVICSLTQRTGTWVVNLPAKFEILGCEPVVRDGVRWLAFLVRSPAFAGVKKGEAIPTVEAEVNGRMFCR